MVNVLNEAQRSQIETEILAGRMIQAIKQYRAATGEGLKVAKDAVEAMETGLRQGAPEKFVGGAAKAGYMGMIVWVVLAVWWRV